MNEPTKKTFFYTSFYLKFFRHIEKLSNFFSSIDNSMEIILNFFSSNSMMFLCPTRISIVMSIVPTNISSIPFFIHHIGVVVAQSKCCPVIRLIEHITLNEHLAWYF